jgi:hypothetical protein
MDFLMVISLEIIKKINKNSQINTFFEKGYGCELFLILWDDYDKESTLSIERTLDKLSLNKPRREAFSRFITRLEANSCIKKSIHTEKKSMRSLSLTDEIYQYLQAIYHDTDAQARAHV